MVNDDFGHDVGDQLLIEAARRLLVCLRKSDTPARMGGDEFAVILPQMKEYQEAEIVAAKIVDLMSQPYTIKGGELNISISIGISLYPDNGDDSDTLFKKADDTMYYVKRHGRNNFKYYSSIE